VLGLTPATVPGAVPYLAADPAKVTAWTGRLGDEGFKIGITWTAGHQTDRNSIRRSIPLPAFAPLAALPGVRLIALQKGAALGDIAHVPFRERIETTDADPDPEADLFLDTAAVMMRLDLVVACDTSTAHLAGALARPVFCALPAAADWKWLHGRDDTPWYPTMRLFRQRAAGGWAEVIRRMAETVRPMVARSPAPAPRPSSP
jgi:hypothetical protein